MRALRCSRVSRCHFDLVLSDAPQHAGGINDHEIAKAPRSVRGRLDLYTIFGDQALSLDAVPPRVNVLDEQVHHEVPGMLWDVKVLQEEAGVAVPEVCQVVRR